MSKKRKSNQRGGGGRVTPKGTGSPKLTTDTGRADSGPADAGLFGTELSDTGMSLDMPTSIASPVLTLPMAGRAQAKARVPSLVAEIANHLDEAAPDRFLRYASTHAEVFDDRRLTPEEQAEAGILDPSDLYESLAESGHSETLTLLLAMGSLAIDDESRDLAAWMAQETGRVATVPEWVRNLDQAVVTGVLEVSDPTPDGDDHVDLLVGLKLVGGQDLAMGLMIDNDQNGALVDSMIGSVSLEEIDPRNSAAGPPNEEFGDLAVAEIPVAELAGRVHTAIANGIGLHPLPVSDTWPLQRPLVEWVLRRIS